MGDIENFQWRILLRQYNNFPSLSHTLASSRYLTPLHSLTVSHAYCRRSNYASLKNIEMHATIEIRSHTCILSMSHTHACHPCILSLSHTLAFSCCHTCLHSLTVTHASLSHTLAFSRCLAHTLAFSHACILSLSHTHPCILSLSHTLTFSCLQ